MLKERFEIRWCDNDRFEHVRKFKYADEAFTFARRHLLRQPRCSVYHCVYSGRITSSRFISTLWDDFPQFFK